MSRIFLIALGVCIVGAIEQGFVAKIDAQSTVAAPENSKGKASQGTQETSDALKATVQPFLATYCNRCHGTKEPKGDRNFKRLRSVISDDNALVDYQDILDQLNLGEMPPTEERQPTDEEKRVVVEQLTQKIAEYHRTRRGATEQAVLRRLNSREYRQTVSHLLNLNTTIFDPTEKFPRDQSVEHLDNVGDALVTSGHLLARYLEAAEQVIDKAMYPLEQPTVQTWTFRDGFDQQPEIDKVHRSTNKFDHMTLYDVIGADKHEGAYGPIHAFEEGVPVDGFYEIRIKAEAVNRIHPYEPEFLGTDPNDPLRLGIRAGNHLAGSLHTPQPVEPLLAELELADKNQWYTVRVWMDAGFTPRFTFRNGLMDARNLWGKLLRRYPDQFPERTGNGIVYDRFTAIKYGKLPQIHIHEVEIKGPLFDSWPKASQRAIFGDDCEEILATRSIDEDEMRKRLNVFASKAYRRSVKAEEIDRVMQVIKHRKQSGRSSLDAFADGLKTILCSPNFLYLEPLPKSGNSSTALASRLSYFLWSSMPDQELIDLANRNELSKPSVLRAQVERMLNDKKSDALVDGFLDSWLTLRDLGSMPPDRGQFRDFYHYDLGTAMRQETHLFTRHLLDQDLSITNFIDSDFTFVNKPLARLYELEPLTESGFQRVELKDRRRGGILGQASVLTVTANGIDTSPVGRGVWILENFLGTPPATPPPDVEPLDPDIRGATTIRDQLKKHRENPTCYECHRKIDPLGFALENFDAIGNWRDSYEKRSKVDASGELPNGKAFENITELKTILMIQKDQVAQALAEKLLAYSLGRMILPSDRPHVDKIVSRLKKSDYGMRELVLQVVLSQPFSNSSDGA